MAKPTFGLGGRLRAAGRALIDDAVPAVLWMIVTVPPSFGFWLVAGDLAGVPQSGARTLISASLLAVGVATLIQVLGGYRLPVFEGPASTYLAAVAVLHASGRASQPRAVAGGLLAAGGFAVLLALVRVDRLIKRLFTPAVVSAFLVIVVITVTPDTLAHVIGRSPAHPLGSAAAWVSALLVIGVAAGGQLVRRLRAFSLLGALLFGSLAYFIVAGFPRGSLVSHWTTPSLFPWGAPQLTLVIAVPFLISALLASFNTVASVNVMAEYVERPARPDQERRGIAAHGIAQFVTACLGNVLGNVPRLDSVAVVRMIADARPRALAIAAAGMIALAFVGPVVSLIAWIPPSVAASLLAFVLAILVMQGLRQIAKLDRRSRWLVFTPAIVPALLWLPLAGSMSQTLQLVANPLLIGVALGVVLDRLVRRPTSIPLPAKSA